MVRKYISVTQQKKMFNKIMDKSNIQSLINSNKYCNDLLYEYYESRFGNSTGDCLPNSIVTYVKRCLRDHRKDYIYQFITLSPDYAKRNIEYTRGNADKMKTFCEKWFNDIRYSEYHWIVEYGKVQGGHLHVHALVRMKHKKQGRNHARDLKEYWKKFFPNNPLISRDYHSQNISGKYYFDKLNYFKNCNKSDHENLIDLNIRGSGGDPAHAP